MWPRFGVKVGNSTLCIACVKEDGNATVISNVQGDRVSQACLLWNGGEEFERGLTAKQKVAATPKQTVANSFQLLLKKEDLTKEKIEAAVQNIPCEYDEKSNAFSLKYTSNDDSKVETKQLTAFDATVELLKAELELAKQYHISKDASEKPVVVLSIPRYYPSESWTQLVEAGEAAGFIVGQVVAEATASLLAYDSNGEDENITKYVLTIKSGGLFSHFAFYAVRHGLYTHLATYGPYPIGGHHFTKELIKFICVEFTRKYKLDPNESRRSLAKIHTTADNCKHKLSTMTATQMYIDSLMDGVDLNMQMTRARFESLVQPLISCFIQYLNESVEKAKSEHPEIKDIYSIVLFGGTMQIPKLQASISAMFPDAKINASVPTDEAVAIGCANQARNLLNPLIREVEATEMVVTNENEILIWHGEDESAAQVLLKRGSLLPRTIVIDVKLDNSTENPNVFWLRMGSFKLEMPLKGAVPEEEAIAQLKDTTNECYCNIEAEISYKETESQIKPTIRVRSNGIKKRSKA